MHLVNHGISGVQLLLRIDETVPAHVLQGGKRQIGANGEHVDAAPAETILCDERQTVADRLARRFRVNLLSVQEDFPAVQGGPGQTGSA